MPIRFAATIEYAAPQMSLIARSIFATSFFVLLQGCSSDNSNPLVLQFQHIVPKNSHAERTQFDPRYQFLRLKVNGNVIFLASDTPEIDSRNKSSVWYSAGREVLRFKDGRLIAAVGLSSEWRDAKLPEFPAWSEIAREKRAMRWTRVRDVMPGYHYGIKDSLLLQEISAPSVSELKEVDPKTLIWFEERLETTGNTVADLPIARYAVDLRAPNGSVVYGEQCVSATLCFSWQRWPVRMGQK